MLTDGSVHIYFLQTEPEELTFATELWERIRRECNTLLFPPQTITFHSPSFPSQPNTTTHLTSFPLPVPELRIYRIWDRPLGPHPIGMFEVNIFTPEQFGAFIPWLVVNRGPLSALVHPNTDDEERDHTQRATWMGAPLPLNLRLFKKRAGA
jgi:aromatic ring-cleaving dioxygenase